MAPLLLVVPVGLGLGLEAPEEPEEPEERAEVGDELLAVGALVEPDPLLTGTTTELPEEDGAGVEPLEAAGVEPLLAAEEPPLGATPGRQLLSGPG